MNDEAKEALALARLILEQPWRDPDDDLSMLARQFLRTREKLEALWHHSGCAFDNCVRCQRDKPIIECLPQFLGPST